MRNRRPDLTLNSAGAEAERSDDQRDADKKDVAVQVRPADLGAPAAEPAVVVGLYGVCDLRLAFGSSPWGFG